MLPLDLLLLLDATDSSIKDGAQSCDRALQCHTSVLWLKPIPKNVTSRIKSHSLGSELTWRFDTQQASWDFGSSAKLLKEPSACWL